MAILERLPDERRKLYMGAPPRSLDQRRAALERANDIRLRRAQIKRDVTAGRAQVPDLLLDPPECILTMPLFDLLLCVRRWGRTKVTRTLAVHKISPVKTIGGLTFRQRREIVAIFRPPPPQRLREVTAIPTRSAPIADYLTVEFDGHDR